MNGVTLNEENRKTSVVSAGLSEHRRNIDFKRDVNHLQIRYRDVLASIFQAQNRLFTVIRVALHSCTAQFIKSENKGMGVK